MKKWIAIIGLLIIVIIGYNYVYQNHRNISAEIPEFDMTAKAITTEFATNSFKGEKKYLNKTISISGNVSESDVDVLTLNSKVFCQLIDSVKTPLKIDSKIKIKGRVIGYDDLLEQVKLDQCTIIN